MIGKRIFKLNVLDTKSPSFCGAKWYNASIWFYQGRTASCHHNPPHDIELATVLENPAAIHNTPIKKQQRQMMQRGEKPLNCQFCWVIEEADPEAISDRVYFSQMSTEKRLQTAFDGDPNGDYDLDYLEASFERTCQMACSYCSPVISSSWAKDIRRNGTYPILPSDQRNHYQWTCDDAVLFQPNEINPYTEAFIRWWDTTLHKTLKILRITGGEPMMSVYLWKLMDWLVENPNKSQCTIHLTTNLSYDTETLNRFLDKCNYINQPIEIWTSNEAVGAKAEYVRDGLDWKVWEENFHLVLKHPKITHVGICATPCAQSIDGYREFLEWIVNIKKNYGIDKVSHSVNPLRFPSFQSVLTLPFEIRQSYHNQILEYYNENRKLFMVFEQEQITRLLDYIITVERPHQEKIMTNEPITFNTNEKTYFTNAELSQDFKKFFDEYDRRRHKNFADTFPNLSNWYNTL